MHNTKKECISSALFQIKTQAAWAILSPYRKWTQYFKQLS